MIVVTGAAGFIGSCLVGKLNAENYNDLVLVDDFTRDHMRVNYESKKYAQLVDREVFPDWLAANQQLVQFVFHLGARTDTTEFDTKIFDRLNLNYSKEIWRLCVKHSLPLVYASSAATYGLGELGYRDDHEICSALKPLNPYGDSKNDFDIWALAQKEKPFFWAGLKFFNVYGPREYYKGNTSSMVIQLGHQILDGKAPRLFTNSNQIFRDFIYIDDVVQANIKACAPKQNGTYNVGTGIPRNFQEIADILQKELDTDLGTDYFPNPYNGYQMNTQADISSTKKNLGFEPKFSLERGIKAYIPEILRLHGTDIS